MGEQGRRTTAVQTREMEDVHGRRVLDLIEGVLDYGVLGEPAYVT